VEHRVTEQAYRLRFENPDGKGEAFELDSLIEAMALLSVHGERLDKPTRVVRHRAGGEVRVNATNRALQPHAGGIIIGWSPPRKDEIRDDQGIGIPNPDTRAFVHYHLAGAYDSNVALVITRGDSRGDNLARLAEILRRTELRGYDLETNLQVHYGLLSWMLGREPLVKPSTQFMSHYLAAVGSIATVARDVDLEHAWAAMLARCPDKEARSVLELKQTLILRPLELLLADAHLLAGFFGRYEGTLFRSSKGRSEFVQNPFETVKALYHYLDLAAKDGKPACDRIWDHDQEIVDAADSFYDALKAASGLSDWASLTKALASDSRPLSISAERWADCRASHAGFSIGMELLLLIAAVAHEAEFDQVTVDEKLEAHFPERFTNPKTRTELQKALAPAPLASSDEIVTPMGGHFYSREAPHLPPLASEGMHFLAGQPLFVIEVMKMFNKISVPFSGTIKKILLADADAKIVTKGQAIFKIEPDHVRVDESPEEAAKKRNALTDRLVASVI